MVVCVTLDLATMFAYDATKQEGVEDGGHATNPVGCLAPEQGMMEMAEGQV